MANVSVLDVKLHGQTIGTITNIGHDRSLFAFTDDYIANERRSVLSLPLRTASASSSPTCRPRRRPSRPFFRTFCRKAICAATWPSGRASNRRANST